MSSSNNSGVTIKFLCDGVKEEELRNWVHFKTWLARIKKNLALQTSNKEHEFYDAPYKLKSLEVEHVTRFGPRIGFLKFTALLQNDNGDTLSGSIFMRGPSVGMLIILQPDDVEAGSLEDRWVILTIQPRPAAASLNFPELPAGMVDDGTFSGAAAKEIQEETGLTIKEENLINMSELAIEESNGSNMNEEDMPRAMFPSAGGCDECIQLFLNEQRIPRDELKELKGKLTGLRDEGEKITLKLVEFCELWREGARDAKALSALALYENLKRVGKIGGG